jgi:hypothetical protein
MLVGCKTRRAWGHPEYRRITARCGADGIPLMPTEMTRSWHEGYLLVQFPQLDPEPHLKANFHMGSDESSRNFFSSVCAAPSDQVGPSLFPAGRVPNGEAYLDQASIRLGGILSVVI